MILVLLLCLICRWLSPDGIILPDTAHLHIMGIDDRQYLAEQSKLWSNRQLGPGRSADDADGFDYKSMLNAVITHPRVDGVSRKTQLVTDAQQLMRLDVYKATPVGCFGSSRFMVAVCSMIQGYCMSLTRW